MAFALVSGATHVSFQNSSSDTDIAYVSDHQIFKICKICDTQPLVQHICLPEIRGKAWNTMNFSFYLRYHRPRIASTHGGMFGRAFPSRPECLNLFPLLQRLRLIQILIPYHLTYAMSLDTNPCGQSSSLRQPPKHQFRARFRRLCL